MNDRLIIKYEIAGYEPDDRFKVWLEITDSTGRPINARSLYGDIGDEVPGGLLKQIIWDLAADNIYLNADINLEIFATRKAKPAPVLAEKQVESRPAIKTDSAVTKKGEQKPPETKTDSDVSKKSAEQPAETKDDSEVTKKREATHPEAKADSIVTRQIAEKPPETKKETAPAGKKTEKESERKPDAGIPAPKKSTPEKKEKNLSDKSMKVGSNLLLSTACPGWGLTRLSGGKPWWLLGVIGYGCIGSSYYLNKLSVSNYDKYTNSSDINKTGEMDDNFNTGKKQYTASNVLALSAITIWVADLGITWIKASKMKRSAKGVKSGSFSVGSSYDYSADTPLISLYYTF